LRVPPLRFAAPAAIAVSLAVATGLLAADRQTPRHRGVDFDARAAARYLDARITWWRGWQNARRDHGTSCVSCHTAVPFALARPALRPVLGETQPSDGERQVIADVVMRVRLWKEVEPFYPDQTVGLPKTSESRGTEAVLNALILSRRDAASGTLSDDARQAFANLWALQFRSGDFKGAWAWLNFKYEPWESTGSSYLGAALAAIAVGDAPGGYAADSSIHDRVEALRSFLQRNADTTHLLNRAMALWASGELSGVLSSAQRQSIVDALYSAQRADGGWATASLGPWKRRDATPLDSASDGYATALALIALERGGVARDEQHVRAGTTWLVQHQEATGMWRAASLNKSRDPATDIGKFMSDAATAYAVIALSGRR
jgi:squalene-hopene/tetraprenyl-beta-curcumene cyclase